MDSTESEILLKMSLACRMKDLHSLRSSLSQAQQLITAQGGTFSSFERRANIRSGNGLLYDVIYWPHSDNAAAAQLMLEAGVDPNAHNGSELYQAADSGQPEVVRVLLDGGADLTIYNDTTLGNPLQAAARYACPHSVLYLLEAGINPNTKSSYRSNVSSTPLLALGLSIRAEADPAAAAEVLRLLIKHGADITASAKGINVLQVAASCNHPRLGHLFLKEAGAAAAVGLVRQGDSTGTTPLHWAAEKCPDASFAAALIDAGGRVNGADDRGRTPLHYAAEAGNLAVLELLLARGADYQLSDRSQHTPLARALNSATPKLHVLGPLIKAGGASQLASSHEYMPPLTRAAALLQLPLARELLQLGAPVNQVSGPTKLTALQVACSRDMMEHFPDPPPGVHIGKVKESDVVKMVQLLLGNGASPNITVKVKNMSASVLACMMPLIVAMVSGFKRVVLMLIKAGADPTLCNAASLQHAILNHQPDMLRMLLASPKVDVNAIFGVTDTGQKACLLHYACMYLDADCVRVLLEAGADVALKDSLGRTSLHLLSGHGNPAPRGMSAAEAKARSQEIGLMLKAADAAMDRSGPAAVAGASGSQNQGAAPGAAAAAAAAAADVQVPGHIAAAASAAEAVKACNHCGVLDGSVRPAGSSSATEVAKLRRCGRCLFVWYCGDECQRAAWKAGHKRSCAAYRGVAAVQATAATALAITAPNAAPL